MSSPVLLRLFFALPCPKDQAQAIAAWRATLPAQGKPSHRDNLHLTLAFIGMQPASLLLQLEQLGASVQLDAFALQLNAIECWANGILHLAPAEPAPALLTLQQRLQEGLSGLGIELEQQTYRPHLTLARQCKELPSVIAPIFAWQVDSFALYLSESTPEGVRYRALASWPLLTL